MLFARKYIAVKESLQKHLKFLIFSKFPPRNIERSVVIHGWLASNSIICQLKIKIFLHFSLLVKYSKNIAPKLDSFTKLNQILRNLKNF